MIFTLKKELKTISIKLKKTNELPKTIKELRFFLSGFINDIFIISKGTDRLDLLAFDYYGDSQLWWIISKANPDKVKRDSFFINPGLQIRIPSQSNVSAIYEEFRLLNK